MQKFIQINLQTGDYLEDIIASRDELLINGELPSDIIETDISGGFYLPRWDGSQWVEGMPSEQIAAKLLLPSPNWEQLAQDLRGTALFAKAYVEAGQSPTVGTALMFFTNSITASKNIQDLEFFTQDLVNKLSSFTQEEVDTLNNTLAKNNFHLSIVFPRQTSPQPTP